jgi:hypothetical protein
VKRPTIPEIPLRSPSRHPVPIPAVHRNSVPALRDREVCPEVTAFRFAPIKHPWCKFGRFSKLIVYCTGA